MKKTNAKLIVLIGVIFVSFSSIIAKSSHAPSLIISVYRMGFTVLLLLPSAISKNIDEVKKIDIKTFSICVVSGIFLALHFATWIESLKYTSVASSTVLVNTHPVFIVLGSFIILKERISRNTLISIAIALTGSIIISTGDSTLGSNILYGDMLAILGAFFVAGYMLIGRIVRQRLSLTAYTFIVYTSSTITLILFSIFTKTSLYPYSLQEMLRFLMLAIFCTILGHSIFNWALEYLKPTYISTAVLGEPVFASIWAIVFFKEIPTAWQLVGSLVIIFGIYRYTRIQEPRTSS
ncbi:DMT family transporter [Wukongibacter baidiensis]|uniref:DMT family transporter n=1 Tax=Wukongibacter baidiensis TaxID=1723361 RepID=UPI003D7FE7DD